MSRIFITGDTHGDIDIKKLNMKIFPEQKELSKDDFLIITGDFGNVWYGTSDLQHRVFGYAIPPQHRAMVGKDDYQLKWFDHKNFTTLFIDGNHENHALLNAYPVEMWHGGLADRVEFGHWYFGHYHRDETIDHEYTCLYQKIFEI